MSNKPKGATHWDGYNTFYKLTSNNIYRWVVISGTGKWTFFDYAKSFDQYYMNELK